jgi:hypothetical protein
MSRKVFMGPDAALFKRCFVRWELRFAPRLIAMTIIISARSPVAAATRRWSERMWESVWTGGGMEAERRPSDEHLVWIRKVVQVLAEPTAACAAAESAAPLAVVLVAHVGAATSKTGEINSGASVSVE